MNRSSTETVRGLLLIALMLLVPGQTLDAQDSPSPSSLDPAPAPTPATSLSDWTGFYIGAHAGISGGSSAWSMTQAGGAPNLSGALNVFHIYSVFDGSGSQFGGVAAGYNHMLPSRVVLGVEVDVSFAAEPAGGAATFNDATELFGTARGRAGHSSEPAKGVNAVQAAGEAIANALAGLRGLDRATILRLRREKFSAIGRTLT